MQNPFSVIKDNRRHHSFRGLHLLQPLRPRGSDVERLARFFFCSWGEIVAPCFIVRNNGIKDFLNIAATFLGEQSMRCDQL